MNDASETQATTVLADRTASAQTERYDFAVFAVATAAAWGHTIDELRIGELSAVPFGAMNAALVAAWPRMARGWRAAGAIGFGLWWAVTVVPYHVVPLAQGVATGQNVSGLLRLVAGGALLALGVAILRRRATPSD